VVISGTVRMILPAGLVLSGCAFDATGDAAGEASASVGDSSEGVTGGDAESGPSMTSAGGMSTDGVTTEAAETGAGIDVPMLRISHGPTHDYGFVHIHGNAVQTFEVTNTGSASAIAIEARPLGAAFSFAGGEYPGEGGTCESTLAPAESCTVVVVFGPTVPRLHATDIVLDYAHSGGVVFESSRRLVGGGITGNLVVNGGGEQSGSPPVGWHVPSFDASGSWEASSCARSKDGNAGSPLAGERCLGHATMHGGGAEHHEETGIEQTYALEAWAEAIDRGEIRFVFSGFGQSRYAQNDDWRILVEFLDTDMNPLGVLGDSGWGWSEDWDEAGGQAVAPSGTRHVRTRLMCRITFQPSVYCDAFFDEIVLSARPNEP
jgi:hypothetical protein